MELRQLRYFIEIYESRSFTGASKALGVSQSALSLSIKDLENNLDAKVFDRSPGGLKLTSVGENLMGYATAILKQHAKALADISGIQRAENSILELGVNSAFPRRFLDDVLRIFYERVPGVTVKISFSAHPLDGVKTNLQRNIWDAAISLDPDGLLDRPEEHIISEDITTSISQIYARPEHEIHKLKSVSWDDLKQSRWALSTTVTSLNMFKAVFDSENEHEPNVALYADSFDLILGAVSSMDFLCFAPNRLIEAGDFSLTVVEQSVIAPVQSNWKLLVCDDLQQTASARMFVKCVKQVIAKRTA